MAKRKKGLLADLQQQRAQQRQQAQRFAREEQRLIAQASRDEQRATREREQRAAKQERERQAAHVAERTEQAQAMTREVQHRCAVAKSVLVNSRPYALADWLRHWESVFQPLPFEPGDWANPAPEPNWQSFEPPPPTGLDRVFGQGHYQRAVEQAREHFREALAQHALRERERMSALVEAEHQHAQAQDARRGQLAAHNNMAREAAAGQSAAVEEFSALIVEQAFHGEAMPADLPVNRDTVFQAEARRLLLTCELPGAAVIPEIQEYRYIRSQDEIRGKARPTQDVERDYARLVAQLVLVVLRDIFAGLPTGVVDEIAVSAQVSTRNPATGQAEKPCLISVSALRSEFDRLVLAELDPQACLRHLNALVSEHPYALEPVKPIFDPDLSKYRLADEAEMAASLDARPVLLEMSPDEFEKLIKRLFEAMGLKAWRTKNSWDEGIDAVAVNEDPIVGGVCVVQAKRYSRLVPAEATRALAGSMEDKRATRGVLVTTSWFGKSAYEFAARNGRMQLIEGTELAYLIKQHLGLDVLVGDLKRRGGGKRVSAR